MTTFLVSVFVLCVFALRVCCVRVCTHSSDGAVFIRALTQATNGAGVSMKVCRVCKPSVAAGGKLATIVSLSYDAEEDTLYTGGLTGITRVITDATGIPFEVRHPLYCHVLCWWWGVLCWWMCCVWLTGC